MNVIKEMLSNIETTPLQIGRVGENLHTQVRINCITIFQDYPEALVDMAVVPPVGDAYPAIVERDGVVVVWDVLSSDLAYEGRGQIQLTFRDDEEIIKTVIGSTTILPSIEPTGEAPTPIENWIDEANEILDKFGEVTNMTASAETVAAGESAEATVSKVDGHFNINFKIPRGASGNETIDDTAGIGDTDKVWSADKDAKEISALKSAKAPIITESISTPADVASFSDGADGMLVKTLTVGIEPVQDLHGQDAPYPAGGGSNKYSTTAGEDTWGVNANATYSNNNGELVIVCTTDMSSGVYGMGEQKTLVNNQSVAKTVSLDIKASVGMSASIQGNIMDITTSYQRKNITIPANTTASLSIYARGTAGTIYVKDIAITNDGTTTYAPYSNICPISGHTGANVYSTGKNLVSNVTDKPNSGSVLYGYYGYPSGAKYGYPMIDKLFKAGTYTVSMDVESSVEANRVCIWVKKSDGEIYRPSNTGDLYPADSSFYMPFTVYSTGTTTNRITASLKINEDVIGIYFGYYSYGASKEYSNLQIEIGDISAYEPYSGSTAEYEFPEAAGTVYGGTLTIHQDGSGELVVDRAKVDLGDLTWTYTTDDSYAGSPYFSSGNVADKKAGSSNMICSQYAVGVNRGSIQDCAIAPWNGTNALSLACRDDRFTDAETFKTAMSGVQLVYELATHVVYTLTVPQVLSLLGTNNLWADTGKINAVDYPADTKLYIDKKLTELQALVLEN